MEKLKFWSVADDVDSAKIEIVAKLAGVEVEKLAAQSTGKPSESVRPSLELSNGVVIKDVHAALIYLSTFDPALYPQDSQVLIDSWLEVTETQYKSAITIWVYPYLKKRAYNDNLIIAASKDTKGLIKELDGSLKKSAFLCGDFISIADISLASELAWPFKLLIDENTRKGYKSVIEWLGRVYSNEHFKSLWGEFVLCEKVAELPKEEVKAVEAKGQKAQGKPQQAQPKKKIPKEEVKVDKEAQEKKQKERQEKKERDAKAKLEAEEKKKKEEAEKKAQDAPKDDTAEVKSCPEQTKE